MEHRLVQADADLLSATLNKTLVKWITDYNVPGATPPRVWRKVEEQKDLGAVATRDLTICQMGFKPSLAYINETYGGDWVVAPPPANAKTTPDNAGGPGGLGPSFAESRSPAVPQNDDIDGLIDAAMSEWQADLKPAAGVIQALMDESAKRGETAAQFLERLPGLLTAGGPLALDGILTQTAFVARIAAQAGIVPTDGR